ncbi:MAG: hypothetical protein WCL08_13030 [Verrucomicrobiota bacterium]
MSPQNKGGRRQTKRRKLTLTGWLTPTGIRSIMDYHTLRQVDVAWLTGVTPRQVRAWLGENSAIPQYASVILQGFHEGRFSMRWLISKIKTTPPFTHADYE